MTRLKLPVGQKVESVNFWVINYTHRVGYNLTVQTKGAVFNTAEFTEAEKDMAVADFLIAKEFVGKVP